MKAYFMRITPRMVAVALASLLSGGCGPDSYHSGVTFLIIALPAPLAFGVFLKRFKPTLLAWQNKYRIAEPSAGGNAAPPRASA